MPVKSLRLDKAVAHNFEVARSEASQLIREGLVAVNGICITDPSFKILLTDLIELDGNEISADSGFAKRYIMLNKPQGFVCADKDNHQSVVLSLLSGENARSSLHCVGRLDIDTTGLLLISDDGDFIHQLTSPKKQISKTYEAYVKNPINDKDIQLFARGLKHPEEKQRYRSALLEPLECCHCLVTVTEGRFHEVKRLFECVGNEVLALKRISIGKLKLDDSLELGDYRPLSADELEAIFN